ncbi:hypothetical protein G6F51_014673 [Rhizopus arrhizus]|uniref:Uncharacterized protein n=1 Tax=Rhizopus oryzae TaxID=64495 RepID=A0A9P7BY72_RHIOR|nr:hypothetical protein G6F51_014673 [Rhizopus arrhizus]
MPHENTNLPAYDTLPQLSSLNSQTPTTASITTNTTTSRSNNKPIPAPTRVSPRSNKGKRPVRLGEEDSQ